MRKGANPILFLMLFPWQLQASSGIRAVVVFPFENQSPRADLNWISESFAEILSTRLALPENYILDRDERNAAAAQLGIPLDTPLTLASDFKVAQTLGVDWAILGNFDVNENLLTARAQLLDVRQLRLSAPLEVSGNLTDLVDLQARLAWRLLATHDRDFTVGSEDDFRRLFGDLRLDAFENYIRGLLASDDASRVRFLTESDRLDPSDHHAAFELGRVYFDQKDYDKSARWLANIDAGFLHYHEALFLRGVDEFFLGHEAAAEKDFEALAVDLPLNEVVNNLGVLESRRGRYDEAFTNFDRAYRNDLSDGDFCFNRGVALWHLNRYQEAAQSLEEAEHANDDDMEAHAFRALALGKLGDVAPQRQEMMWLSAHEVEAAAGKEEDVLPQPRLKKNYDGRAFGLLALTIHNALEERLANASPQDHAAAHFALGEKYLAKKRSAEAEREFAEVVNLTPSDPMAHLAFAQALEAEGKHQEAAAELDASLHLKNSVEARLSLARVYLALKQPALARQESQAALELDPNNLEAQRLIQQIPAPAEPLRKTP